MLRNLIISSLIFLLSFGFLVYDTAKVLAKDEEQQYYFALKANYIWFDGDFEKFEELEKDIGGRLIFGATKDIYTCEFSYSYSEHNIINSSPNLTAELESLNLSIKVTPMSLIEKRCQPYGLIGYGITRLSVQDLIDLKYEGKGFHLGFGINCKLGNKIAVDGSVAYYRYNMDKVELLGVELSLPEDTILINTIASLGIKYYF
jgi:opacity protein-like surface antigen